MLHINNRTINIGANVVIDDKLIAMLSATITKQDTTMSPNINITIIDEETYANNEECKSDIVEFNDMVCRLVANDVFKEEEIYGI